MSTQNPSANTMKGFFILVSIGTTSIVASLGISLMFGETFDQTQWTVILMCVGLMIPGAFFLGRALSTQFIINPISEYDSSTEDTVKIAEKTLLELTEALQNRMTDLNKTVNALEPFSIKARNMFFIIFGAFSAGFLSFFILIYLAGFFGI